MATENTLIFDKLLETRTSRMEFWLEKQDNRIPSPWEISRFIDRYNCNYYKGYLLNTISTLLKLGVHPSNILVLDHSMRLDLFGRRGDWKLLDHIDLDWDDKRQESNASRYLIQLYDIGLPYSIYPSRSVSIMRWTFSTFAKVSGYLYTTPLRHNLSHKMLSQFTSRLMMAPMDKELRDKFLDAMRDEAAEHLKYLSDKEQTTHFSEIVRRLEAAVTEYKKIDEIVFCGEGNSIYYKQMERETAKDLETKSGVGKAINNFFSRFKQVKRPVVAVFYKEIKRLQILGLPLINAEYDDPVFLDLKGMNHNSPTILDFIGGACVYGTEIAQNIQDIKHHCVINKLKEHEKELDIQIKETILAQEQEKLKQEQLTTDTCAIKRTIAAMDLNKKMAEQYGSQEGSYDQQLRNGLKGAYKQFAAYSKKLLSDGNYKVTDYEIKELDKKV